MTVTAPLRGPYSAIDFGPNRRILGLTRLAVAERVGALSQWGRTITRVAVAYTSGHCINVSQYLTRSTCPRGVPTEFCMLAVRLAVANAAPCDKDASGEVARSQCVLNCPSSPLRQSRVSPRSVSTLRWPVAVCWHSAGQIRGRKGARARLQRADLAPARPAVTSQGGCHRCNCLPGPAGERARSMSIVSIVLIP